MASRCTRFVDARHLQQFNVVLACKEWLEKYCPNQLAEHMRSMRADSSEFLGYPGTKARYREVEEGAQLQRNGCLSAMQEIYRQGRRFKFFEYDTQRTLG